jgi:hypothetical protein
MDDEFRVGDRVEHTHSQGGMGFGTVTSIDDGYVTVTYDRQNQFRRPRTGVYGEHWFSTARAKLIRHPPL